MTRINTIDVAHLLDQHLFIEYREITRVGSLARPLDDYGSYVLGTGHVKFFYNKQPYLAARCEQLRLELIKRGYNVTTKTCKEHDFAQVDWQPTIDDIKTNIVRLQSKLFDRPDFYTLHGKRVPVTYYAKIYEEHYQ